MSESVMFQQIFSARFLREEGAGRLGQFCRP